MRHHFPSDMIMPRSYPTQNHPMMNVSKKQTKKESKALARQPHTEQLEGIERVSMDMWPAYINTTLDCVPSTGGDDVRLVSCDQHLRRGRGQGSTVGTPGIVKQRRAQAHQIMTTSVISMAGSFRFTSTESTVFVTPVSYVSDWNVITPQTARHITNVLANALTTINSALSSSVLPENFKSPYFAASVGDMANGRNCQTSSVRLPLSPDGSSS